MKMKRNRQNRTRRRVAWLLPAAWIAAGAALAADAPASRPARRPDSRASDATRSASVISSSGRFVVSGPDRLKNHDAAQWAESLATALEAALKTDLSGHGARSVTMVFRESADTVDGDVRIEEYRTGGGIAHTLRVVNPARMESGRLQALLCRVLLRRHLLATAQKYKRSLPAANGVLSSRDSLPVWLWEGLSQNLARDTRLRNMQIIGGEWRLGRLPPLATLLDEPGAWEAGLPAGDWNDLRRRAAYGVFLEWLLSAPDAGLAMETLLRELAFGRTLSAAQTARLLPGVGSPTDWQRQWETWLRTEDRRIRFAGRFFPENAERFEREWLLSPADYGISLSAPENWNWDDFIEAQPTPWRRTFISSKSVDLNFAAAGRGDEIQGVAKMYIAFLEALAQDRKSAALRAQLAAARRRMQHVKDAAYGPPRPRHEAGGNEEDRHEP
jgi:hypothetical protein